MQEKNKYFIMTIGIFAFIVLSFNCRTMGLRQTAAPLPVKTKETTFFLGLGLVQTHLTGLSIDTGFQYRQGTKKNTEFQFNFAANLFLLFPRQPLQPIVMLYSDFGAKLQLLHYRNTYLSIIPYGGIFGGWSPYARLSYTYLGPIAGFKFLSSQTIAKKSLNAIYWGLNFQMKENFMGFYYIKDSLAHSYPASIPFFDFDFIFSFGLAQNFFTKKKADIRLYHELGIGISFQTSFTYYPADYSIDDFKVVNPVILICYSFNVGKRKKM